MGLLVRRDFDLFSRTSFLLFFELFIVYNYLFSTVKTSRAQHVVANEFLCSKFYQVLMASFPNRRQNPALFIHIHKRAATEAVPFVIG